MIFQLYHYFIFYILDYEFAILCSLTIIIIFTKQFDKEGIVQDTSRVQPP